MPYFHSSTLRFHSSTLLYFHSSTLLGFTVPYCYVSTIPQFHCRISTVLHCWVSTVPFFYASTIPHWWVSTVPHCWFATVSHSNFVTSTLHTVSSHQTSLPDLQALLSPWKLVHTTIILYTPALYWTEMDLKHVWYILFAPIQMFNKENLLVTSVSSSAFTKEKFWIKSWGRRVCIMGCKRKESWQNHAMRMYRVLQFFLNNLSFLQLTHGRFLILN